MGALHFHQSPWPALVAVLACACAPLHDFDQITSGQGKAPADSGIRDAHIAPADGAMGGKNGRSDSRVLADGQSASKDPDGPSTLADAMVCPPCTLVADAAPACEDARSSAGQSGEDAPSDQAKGPWFDSGGLLPDSAGQGFDIQADGKVPEQVAADLPDIDDYPIRGMLTFIPNSTWGTWPAFEVHTPTATYWLLKAKAAIVSIVDSGGLQWINFSSDFRPKRGVPNLGGCCQPGNSDSAPTISTVLDPSMTVTSTHVRFISKSADGSIWLVWDFFLTHFTLTINRAGKSFGFTYQGVPGASLSLLDQIVFSDGTTQSALVPRNQDLPGPAEWAYFAHPANKHSLFLIQHSDDSLADTYRIADGDTGLFRFGDGQISQTPIRFSLGLIDSCDAQVVRKRIEFVRDAIR